MDSRQRFTLAMRHQDSGRPPFDIGATSLTSMSAGCQKALAEELGFSIQCSPGSKNADEKILEWAGTDFRSVGAIVKDLPSPHTRRISETEDVDCWGVHRRLVSGYREIVNSPLRGASLDDLLNYSWPQPHIAEALLAQWESEARRLAQEGRYVIVGEHPVYGMLELGCWMCGYDEFLFKMIAEPDFVRFFFDRVCAIQFRIMEQYYPVLAPYIDLTMSGDDFGMQTRPLLSPEMFAELIAPYFSRRIARAKELGRCYYWHHTCGSVLGLLDQIIVCGVDILNPIQTSASDMEPRRLKSAFGDRLVFWGGMDVQQFLPRATPEQVREQTLLLVAELGHDGGYVMAPAHNMQDDIPPENIIAWVETMRQAAKESSYTT